MPASGIREMMGRAARMDDVVHLEVGEPGFRTPEHIIDAASRAARDGHTRYTPAAGIPALREAVADRVSERWGRAVTAEQVIVTVGGVNALALAGLASLDRGDEVLLPDPGWPNYASLAELTGATAVTYPLPAELGFAPDLDRLATLVTPRTRALVINTPGNPTGGVFDAGVVEGLVSLCDRHGIRLIADEMYEDFVFGASHASAGAAGEDVIYVSGCSKTYAMTGWRLGFAVAPEPVVTAMERLQEPLVSCASSISQAAAVAALRGPQDCVAEMRAAYERRRDTVVELLGPELVPVTPKGGFFAMVDLGATGLRGMELGLAVLESARVATVPGAAFGTTIDGFVRVSFAAADDDVREGCRRLLEFHAAHQPMATPSLRGSEPPA
jgi:aspartate/methionine/tyrosine aminotransferase